MGAIEPKDRTEGLTSIRFFAAFSVLTAHFGDSIVKSSPRLIAEYLQAGGGAVLYFFILSGFIMTHVYYYRPLEATSLRKRYYLARSARIAPLYYLTLILGLIGLIYKGVDGYSPAHVFASVAAKFTFLHSFFPNYVVEPAWAVATWTLSVEFVFYLFFPLIVSKVTRSNIKHAWLQLAGALLSCFVIVTLLKHFTEVRFGSKVYYFSPISYPGFFWAGMVTERLRREYSKYLSIKWWHFFVIGLFGVLTVQMFHFPIGIDYAVRAMIGCMFIIGVFYVKGFAARVLKSRGLVLLGEASYAMYLLHGPISSMLDIVLRRTGLSRVEENPVVFTFYILLTVGLSIIAFLFFESPLRKAILRKWSSH